MIVVVDINPPIPSQGNTVCVTFQAQAGSSPSVQFDPRNGGQVFGVQPQLHPGSSDRWTVCFTWPSTSAGVLLIKAGNENLNLTLRGIT